MYIEATGHPAAVEQGLRMMRKLGTFVEFSVMREPVTVDWTIDDVTVVLMKKDS